jgi:LTXXQ motif family protein
MSFPSCWRAVLAALVCAVAVAPAAAQMPAAQPYAGLQSRAIKSLSPDDTAGLLAGRGMGFALPAELNGYPGPLHVLDLADQLGLTGDQRAEVQKLFDAMKAEAIPLGHRLVDAEKDLDRQFARRTITPEALKAATAAIGEIRGELRNTHLKYHLSTAALLKDEQIRRYGELRGYAGPVTAGPGPAGRPMPGCEGTGCPMHHHMMGRPPE